MYVGDVMESSKRKRVQSKKCIDNCDPKKNALLDKIAPIERSLPKKKRKQTPQQLKNLEKGRLALAAKYSKKK